MEQRSDGATVLLGMPEFVVGAQLVVGRELWLMVETTSGVVGCEGCGTRAVGHGRRRLKVRDLPMADRPVVLVWAKRLWRCPDPDCAVGHVVRGGRRHRAAGGVDRAGPSRDLPSRG